MWIARQKNSDEVETITLPDTRRKKEQDGLTKAGHNDRFLCPSTALIIFHE